MKTLGVIPARGGSTGVHRKNIRDLFGAPLIAWTIESALNSSLLTELCVTTEDEEIQCVAMKYGASVPFIRPTELATDTALAIPTIQHATIAMEEINKEIYDIVVMLQPTCPLRTSEDIDRSVNMLIDNPTADSVISVVNVGNNHPMKMKVFIDESFITNYASPPVENPPRQLLPALYIVNGGLYTTRRCVLIQNSSFSGEKSLGLIMPESRSINIDTDIDFLLAEYEARRQGLTPPTQPTSGA